MLQVVVTSIWNNGLDTTATVVWQKVLSISSDWKQNNVPTSRHIFS
jgi:hypothetical protein